MKFAYLGCGNHLFEIFANSVEEANIVTFICPLCGEQAAVQTRQGGGLVIAIDKYNKGIESK